MPFELESTKAQEFVNSLNSLHQRREEEREEIRRQKAADEIAKQQARLAVFEICLREVGLAIKPTEEVVHLDGFRICFYWRGGTNDSAEKIIAAPELGCLKILVGQLSQFRYANTKEELVFALEELGYFKPKPVPLPKAPWDKSGEPDDEITF